MKWTVGTKLGLGFGLALVVFVAVGVISYLTTLETVASAGMREHTYEVLRRLDDTLAALTDVEDGQRGYLITGEESYLEPYRAALDKIDQDVAELRKLTSDNPHQQHRLDMLEPAIKGRIDLAKETVDARHTSEEAAVQYIKSGKGKNFMDDIRKIIGDMRGEEEDLLAKRAEATQNNITRTEWAIVLGTGLAVLIGAIGGLMITRNIANPLGELTAVADRIAQGDLSSKIDAGERTDEVGGLTRAFERMTGALRAFAGTADQIANGDLRATIKPQSADDILGTALAKMLENLRSQIGQMTESANKLGSSASEIVASTAQLAASSSESATAVSETTTTVEEVRQTAQMSNQKAKTVSDNAQRAVQTSVSGKKSADEAVVGMNRIRQQMEAIAASMVRLSEQGQTIGLIIATVEDLAAQSNLLAVNAAIEAAKAGEHGKGFGVVAQEVKSLAEQSKQATTQVRNILTEIQKATTSAVMVTEQGNKAVEVGERQTLSAGESIQMLTGNVTEAAQAATQIAASSQQQLVGMDQVAGAMESIKQATTQNVASAKQLESAARDLNELSQRFKQMVQRYKV